MLPALKRLCDRKITDPLYVFETHVGYGIL
jgi:hypothetical protein